MSDDLVALLEHAKGRPWITGREPARYNDRDISCVRLTQDDLDVLIEALLLLDDTCRDPER